jgi:hypothetical protein
MFCPVFSVLSWLFPYRPSCPAYSVLAVLSPILLSFLSFSGYPVWLFYPPFPRPSCQNIKDSEQLLSILNNALQFSRYKDGFNKHLPLYGLFNYSNCWYCPCS